MATVKELFGLLFTVVTVVSVQQAFQDGEDNFALSDKRYRDMEKELKNLLARTENKMDDKYTSLLNDHLVLKDRSEKIENDNMVLKERYEKIENDNIALKDSVASLKIENLELKNQFLKLRNESICEFESGEGNALFANKESAKESKGGHENNFDKRRKGASNPTDRHMDSQEKRLLLPVTSTPSSFVLTQARVAFYAQLSQALTNVGDNQHIVFGNVITNVGNAFLGTTSTFVSPVAGTYVFLWTILSEPDKHIETKIVWNGRDVGYTYSYNDNYYNSGSNAVVLDLKAHDTVWIRVHGGFHDTGTIAHADHSTFSGFILWSNN